MKDRMSNWAQLRFKALCLTLGLSLGSGIMILGQGCAGGACLSCGACASKLPMLALPILADAALIMVGKTRIGLPEVEPGKEKADSEVE